MTTDLQSSATNYFELYEQDHCLWLEATANLLRSGQLELIDFEHLIEEIEDIGKEKRRELKNRLRVLLMHLLKYKYQPDKCSSSWVNTILEQYRQIESLLEDSPSLKPYYLEIFSDCYLKAVVDASTETKLPIDTFPSGSPFSATDVINSAYIHSLFEVE